MRRIDISLALLLAATPLVAQQTTQQARESDPTRKVAGGTIAAGWQVRLDDKDASRYTVDDTKLVKMGNGWHVTSGPAALYYNPAIAPAAEEFTLRGTFVSAKAPTHPEAYGLFLSARDLEDSEKQAYYYFLVRGDGRFLINHRAGREVHRIQSWQAHPAVNSRDSTGKVRDELMVRAAADSVRFFVNGKPVAAIARAMFGDPRGLAGLRINHNLDLHVDGFAVVPGAK